MAGSLRAKWGAKIEFILTCVAYSVGLGNIWRFPYLAFKNGGGAFLIPYWLSQIFVGVPVYFMELSFGQFASLGPITIWRANLLFKGIGISMVLICTFIILYYNVIVAYVCFYFFSSMQSPLPWSHCGHYWSSPNCVVVDSAGTIVSNTSSLNLTDVFDDNTSFFNNNNFTSSVVNLTGTISPTQDYFERFVLEMTDGIHNLGGLNWKMSLCLLLTWIVVFLVLIKGIRSLGKVVYFTATFPFMLLISLLIRSALLPGATQGMLYFLTPRWDRLKDATVWSDAATQVCYSLGVCMGGLNVMASYNNFKNNSLRDSILVPCVDCFTSLLCGLVVFSVLGFMAHTKGVSIEDVAVGGPGLAFIAYPEALSSMPAPTVWAVLFFFMMTIIGFSSQFSMTETVMTAIIDEFSSVLRKSFQTTVYFRLGVCIVLFLLALPMTTGGGIYLLNIVDTSIGGYPLLIVGFCEVITIMYIYGYGRFTEDIAMMLGKKPSVYFKICWCFLTPVILLGVLVFKAINYGPLSYIDYVYPAWAQFLGWMVVITAIIFIPGWFLCYFCKHGGCKVLRKISTPPPDWGPSLPENRTGRYAPSPEEGKHAGQGIPSIVVTGVEESDRGTDNMAFDQGKVEMSTHEREVAGEVVKVWKEGVGDSVGSASEDNVNGNAVGIVKDALDDNGKGDTAGSITGSAYDSCRGSTVGSIKGPVYDSCRGSTVGSIKGPVYDSCRGSTVGSIRSRTADVYKERIDANVRGWVEDNFIGSTTGSIRSRGRDDFKGSTFGSIRSRTGDSLKGSTMGSIRSRKEEFFKGRSDGSTGSRSEDYFKGRSDGSVRSRTGDYSKGRSDGSVRSRTGDYFKGRSDGSVGSRTEDVFRGHSIKSRTDGTLKKGSVEDSCKGSMGGSIKSRKDGSMKGRPVGSTRSMKGISVIDVTSSQGTSDEMYAQDIPNECYTDTANTDKNWLAYGLDDVSAVGVGKQSGTPYERNIPTHADRIAETVNRSRGDVVYDAEEADLRATLNRMKDLSSMYVQEPPDNGIKNQGHDSVYSLDEPGSRNSFRRSSEGKTAKKMGVRVYPLEDASVKDGIPIRKDSVGNMARSWEDRTGIKTAPTGSVRSMKRGIALTDDNMAQLPI